MMEVMQNNTVNINDFDMKSEVFTNYARLIRLTIEEGTERMKQYVLTHLPGKEPLDVALNNKKSHFENLRKKHKLNKQQFEQLFPLPHMSVIDLNLSTFDMSLWYILVRNLAENKPKVPFGKYEKSHGPTIYDQLPQHHIIRIRNMRNHLVHVQSMKIDNTTFDIMWKQLSESLMALGSTEEIIDSHKSQNLDPMKTAQQYIKIREQVFIEYESLYKTELKKKKQLIGLIVAVAVVLVTVTIVTGYILYLHAKTWSSCVHSLQLLYSTSQGNKYISMVISFTFVFYFKGLIQKNFVGNFLMLLIKLRNIFLGLCSTEMT